MGRWLAAALIAALAGLPSMAQDTGTADAPDVLDYLPDGADRMTVPVSISGSGPYRFLVDTGSERTVIARELAERLRLGPGAGTLVHSMTEVRSARTAVIPALGVGRRTVANIHAPLLEQRHLGAEGMLGVDSLQAQRVVFDFARRQLQLTPSREEEMVWPRDSIVVTGRRMLGRLVLVDADVEGTRIRAIVDTGAEVSVGNARLRQRLARRGRIGATVPITLHSVTGGTLSADATRVRRIRIGGVQITDMPIAFADAHVFRKLGLDDRPALMLGMDALGLFERVSIDFANRRVRLMPYEASMEALRVAAAD